jgi:hypothetical protein
VILVISFTAAGVTAAIFPVAVSGNHLHEGAECGTAFFHSGPAWCNGVNTPFEVVALSFFGLSVVAAAALVVGLRRTKRPR